MGADRGQPSHRITLRLEPRTLFLLALLLLALGSVAHGLAQAVRDLDTWLLLTVAILGVLAGWMMAALHLPGWLAGISASLLGIEVVLGRVGRLDRKLTAVGQALINLLWEIGRWLLSWKIEKGQWELTGPPPNWIAVSQTLAELWAAVNTLLHRGYQWLLGFMAGRPAFDPVAAALLWALAMWAVAFWAGWTVRRHQPLPGIAPAGALLVTTLAYTRARPTILLALLGVTLLLMAMVQHDARERRWRAIRIDFSSDLWMDLTRAAAFLSLALVTTAALIPSISVRQIVESLQKLTAEQAGETRPVAKSLGLETQPDLEKKAPGPAQVSGMPRLHTVGLKPQLSPQVVMIIRTSDLGLDLDPSRMTPFERRMLRLEEPAWRYYWRSITYDSYTGRGWTTSQTEMVKYEAGQPAVARDRPFHRVVRQKVQVIGDPTGVLHVAGTLITADQEFGIAWRSAEDAFGASLTGRISRPLSYQADSLVPVVSEKQLRAAGSNYPEWIRQRYLALPDQVPDRVLALARDLTATEPTPYDQAVAIESYLRTFSYTLDVHLPPFGRDAADYFLFDLKRGHCDYFATAMAVLARAAGLPARLVVGYASGTYDADRARFIVTQADAHTWVEIYFPGYGWVEFEPTAGRPPIERPAEPSLIEWPEPEEPLRPQEPPSETGSRVTQFLGMGMWGALAAATLVGLVWPIVDSWRLRLIPPVATVATLYRRLQRHGRRLGVPMREGDTPYEFARSFARYFARLARGKCWNTALAPAIPEVQWLIHLYVQASYTPHPPDPDAQRQAIQTWQRLCRRLWMVWALQKWRSSPLGRFSRPST